MDLWTFQRFKRPRLIVDAVAHEKDSTIVTLRSGTHVYRLAFDDAGAAKEIACELKTLTDSDASLWATLREYPPDSGWHLLANFLDTHSLISENRSDVDIQISEQAHRIRECVEDTKAAILAGLSKEKVEIISKHAEKLHRQLHQPWSTANTSAPEADVFDINIQPNFFLALLSIEFEYFRRFSPLTLAAADLLLQSIAQDLLDSDTTEPDLYLMESAGLYDMHDLAAHLWLVGRSLMWSSEEKALRLATAPIPVPYLTSGLEFIRRLEILVRETIARWDDNPYTSAVEKLSNSFSPLIAGTFVEQYHVTRRFVEIIAPLLSMRLAEPLRSILFRYYNEEYGHEVLESANCKALGIAEEVLEDSIPLPLHFAFVDVLTLFAGSDPMTSFAAIMTSEGIFGEPPRMSIRLSATGSDAAFRKVATTHEELNESLNHNSIYRNLFEQVTALGPAKQATVMRRVLFLLELNHRAWSDIVDFYGRQDHLSLQGYCGRLLRVKGNY